MPHNSMANINPFTRMPYPSKATFHPFPRLPFELRIKIWAFAAVDDRVLRVKKTWYRLDGYWSPTPVPDVTRACRESRKHCYRKAFTIDGSPRYIWANFDRDIIQMRCGLLSEELDRDEIRRLRVELVEEDGLDETDCFHDHTHRLRDFPKLEGFQLLVSNRLFRWTNVIKETHWGACPRGNVQVVDGRTGEWIDEKTSGVYQDYIDTDGGENDDYTRVVDDEEEEKGRVEAIKRLQMPLPRIALDYNVGMFRFNSWAA